jgi:hypothetical protein
MYTKLFLGFFSFKCIYECSVSFWFFVYTRDRKEEDKKNIYNIKRETHHITVGKRIKREREKEITSKQIT